MNVSPTAMDQQIKNVINELYIEHYFDLVRSGLKIYPEQQASIELELEKICRRLNSRPKIKTSARRSL